MKKKSQVFTWLFFYFFLFIIFLFFLTEDHIDVADSGEFLVGAYLLNNVHPPGYALYLLFGKIVLSFFSGRYEFVLAAVSTFFLFLNSFFLYLIWKSLLTNSRKSKLYLFLLSLFFIFSSYGIQVGSSIEVYTLDNTLYLASIYTFILALKKKSLRYFYLFFYLSGFSIFFRNINLAYLFPFILWGAFLLLKKKWRNYVLVIFFLILPFSLSLYYPLRDISPQVVYSPFSFHPGRFWKSFWGFLSAEMYRGRFKIKYFLWVRFKEILLYILKQIFPLLILFLLSLLVSNTSKIRFLLKKSFYPLYVISIYYTIFTIVFFSSYNSYDIATMLGVLLLFFYGLLGWLSYILFNRVLNNKWIYILMILFFLFWMIIDIYFKPVSIDGKKLFYQFTKILPPKIYFFTSQDHQSNAYAVERYVYHKKFSFEVISSFRKDFDFKMNENPIKAGIRFKLAGPIFYIQTFKDFKYKEEKYWGWHVLEDSYSLPKILTPEGVTTYKFSPYLEVYSPKLIVHLQDGMGIIKCEFVYKFLRYLNLNLDVFKSSMIILPVDNIKGGIEDIIQEGGAFKYFEFGIKGKLYSEGILYETLKKPLDKGKYKVFFFVKHYDARKIKGHLFDFDISNRGNAVLFKTQKGAEILKDENTGQRIFQIGEFEVP